MFTEYGDKNVLSHWMTFLSYSITINLRKSKVNLQILINYCTCWTAIFTAAAPAMYSCSVVSWRCCNICSRRCCSCSKCRKAPGDTGGCQMPSTCRSAARDLKGIVKSKTILFDTSTLFVMWIKPKFSWWFLYFHSFYYNRPFPQAPPASPSAPLSDVPGAEVQLQRRRL